MSIEIPPELQWVAYLAGSEWPKGDEDAMWRIGKVWQGAVAQLNAVIPDLQRVQAETLSVLSGQTADAAVAAFQQEFSGDLSLENLAAAMSALGESARQTGTEIQYTKLNIIVTLAIAAVEISYYLYLAGLTFGASLALIPAVEAITIAAIRALVAALMRRIVAAVTEALTRTVLWQLAKTAALKGAVGAGVGGALGFVQESAIELGQWATGHRDGLDWHQIGLSFTGGLVGGAGGALTHGALAGALGEAKTILGKGVNGALTHYTSGVVGNVAGSLPTGGGMNAKEIFGGAGSNAVPGIAGDAVSKHVASNGDHPGGPTSKADSGPAESSADAKTADAEGANETHDEVLPRYDGPPPPYRGPHGAPVAGEGAVVPPPTAAGDVSGSSGDVSGSAAAASVRVKGVGAGSHDAAGSAGVSGQSGSSGIQDISSAHNSSSGSGSGIGAGSAGGYKGGLLQSGASAAEQRTGWARGGADGGAVGDRAGTASSVGGPSAGWDARPIEAGRSQSGITSTSRSSPPPFITVPRATPGAGTGSGSSSARGSGAFGARQPTSATPSALTPTDSHVAPPPATYTAPAQAPSTALGRFAGRDGSHTSSTPDEAAAVWSQSSRDEGTHGGPAREASDRPGGPDRNDSARTRAIAHQQQPDSPEPPPPAGASRLQPLPPQTAAPHATPDTDVFSSHASIKDIQGGKSVEPAEPATVPGARSYSTGAAPTPRATSEREPEQRRGGPSEVARGKRPAHETADRLGEKSSSVWGDGRVLAAGQQGGLPHTSTTTAEQVTVSSEGGAHTGTRGGRWGSVASTPSAGGHTHSRGSEVGQSDAGRLRSGVTNTARPSPSRGANLPQGGSGSASSGARGAGAGGSDTRPQTSATSSPVTHTQDRAAPSWVAESPSHAGHPTVEARLLQQQPSAGKAQYEAPADAPPPRAAGNDHPARVRRDQAVVEDVSADELARSDPRRPLVDGGGGDHDRGVGTGDRLAEGTTWSRDGEGWFVAGRGGRIVLGFGGGDRVVELAVGARGVFDSSGVLQLVVLPDGTSHDRGVDGAWSRARQHPGEVQVIKTGHGDVLGADNEKVIDTKTGETIAYRQIKDDNGRRLSQPTVLLADGRGGWKHTTAPVDAVSYEAWLAAANQAHDTARTLFDIAGRSDVSIPEAQRLTHLSVEGLKTLLDGTPEDMKAALYEALRRTKGVALRWTQLSAGLALERGDVVNMAAGEGKSYLFLLSNALEAAKLAKAGGGAVHMHTTRDVLAEQLEPDFRAVLEPLGYAVHRLNSDNPPPSPQAGQPTVYLGTSHDAAFTLLKHGSVGGPDGAGPGMHAEIDEIDEALVYSHGHYILSEGTAADAAPAVADPIRGMRRFLSEKLASGELSEADFGRQPGTVGGPAALTEAGVAKATALLDPHGTLAGAEVDAQLAKLQMAAAAHWEYVENVHYVIDDDTGKLYIIDQTTHQVLYDPRTSSESRWNGGLAQALEAKHGLRVRHDSDGDKKVTALGLYGKYAKVVGASGTANGKNELFAKQGLSSQIADIPRYYTSGLTTHDIAVSANLKEKLSAIADDVQQMQALGDTARPQLILAHRNDLVRHLSARLHERHVDHVSIDAKWFLKQGLRRDEAFKEVVAHAGMPGKVLVINMQGARGVDIPLDDAAKALGGLHVVVTGHSEVSKDIDIQAENRAARSGDRGSVKFYISPDDDLFRLSNNPHVQLAVIQYRAALHTDADLTPAQQGLRDAVPLSQNDAAHRRKIRHTPPSPTPTPHTTPTHTDHPGQHPTLHRRAPPTSNGSGRDRGGVPGDVSEGSTSTKSWTDIEVPTPLLSDVPASPSPQPGYLSNTARFGDQAPTPADHSAGPSPAAKQGHTATTTGSDTDPTQVARGDSGPLGGDHPTLAEAVEARTALHSTPDVGGQVVPQMDEHRWTQWEQTSGFPRADLSDPELESIEAIRGWLGRVNPNHVTTAGRDPNPDKDVAGRRENCGQTALVVFDRLSGRPSFQVAGRDTIPVHLMSQASGLPQYNSTPERIYDLLSAAGQGAHTLIAALSGGDGTHLATATTAHYVNVYNDGHQIWVLDGQTGTTHSWTEYITGHDSTHWVISTSHHLTGPNPFHDRPIAAHNLHPDLTTGADPRRHLATASPGMPPRRQGRGQPIAATARQPVASANQWPRRLRLRFPALAELDTLPPEQFGLLIQALERNPDSAAGVAHHAAAMKKIIASWPNIFDRLASLSSTDLVSVDLPYFVDHPDSAGLFDRLEHDVDARRRYLTGLRLPALHVLGRHWPALLDLSEYISDSAVLVIATLPGLGAAIRDRTDGPLIVRELVHSPGLVEVFFTILRSAHSNGRVFWAGTPWTQNQYRRLFDHSWLFDQLRRHPVLAWAVVNVTGMLEAVTENKDNIDRWTQVVNGHRLLVEVLLDSPVLSRRLTGDISLFEAAAQNRAVAAVLSVDPSRFDEVPDEDLPGVLDRVVDPAPTAAPVGSLPWQRALQGSAALRLAAQGDQNHKGGRPGLVTETLRALLNRERATIVAVLAELPGLLEHPHQYRQLLLGADHPFSPRAVLEKREMWQAYGADVDRDARSAQAGGWPVLPALRRLVPAMLKSLLVTHSLVAERFGGDPGGDETRRLLVGRAGSDEQMGQALQWSGALRDYINGFITTNFAQLIIDNPPLIARLAHDESMLTAVKPGYTVLYSRLKDKPELADVLSAHDNLLLRMVARNPGLQDTLAYIYANDLVESLRMLVAHRGRRAGVQLFVDKPNPRLQVNHWRRLLGAPAFFGYIGRAPEDVRAALTEFPQLVVDLASRPLPESFDNSLGTLPALADEQQQKKKKRMQAWRDHLREVIPRLGEPVLLADGSVVGPGETARVQNFQQYVVERDEARAAELLDSIARSADDRADLQRVRTIVSANKDLAGLIREQPGLARALLTHPALVDFVAESPELRAVLSGPDAYLVTRTMNSAPELIFTLRESASLYRTYVSSPTVRVNLARSEFAPMAVANPEFYALEFERPEIYRPLLTHDDAYVLVVGNPVLTVALRDYGVAAVKLLLPAGVGETARGAGDGSRSLAGRLSGQPSVVAAAVASSMASLEFFARDPGVGPDPIEVFARVSGLAEVLAQRRYELTPDEFERVFAVLTSHPSQVGSVFASRPMVGLVAKVPAVVGAMAQVPALGAVLADNGAIRQLVRTRPQVLEAIVREGEGLVRALAAQPGLVAFLTEDATHADTVLGTPFLLEAVRANRAIVSVARHVRSTETAADVWTVLSRHEALTRVLGPAEIRALVRRPKLLKVLTETPQEQADLSPQLWRKVLRDTYLLSLLDSRRDFAQALVADPQLKAHYDSDPERFTAVVAQWRATPSGIDALRTALTAAQARQPGATTSARGGRVAVAAELVEATGGADPSVVPPSGDDAGKGAGRPQRTESALRVGVGAADRWWLMEAGRSGELQELLATPGRGEVVRALTEEPHMLTLAVIRPDIVAALIEEPDRVADYRWANSIDVDDELRDFDQAFAHYLWRHDLALSTQQQDALRGQARISWAWERSRRHAAQVAAAQERRSRFERLNPIDSNTWQMSGRILYAKVSAHDFDRGADRQRVLRALAQDRTGVREKTLALHTALHAHLDFGVQGVTFTYLLGEDGQVDTLVYALSKARHDNKYKWGSVFQQGPLPVREAASEAAFKESIGRLARRQEIIADITAQLSRSAQPSHHADPVAPARAAILDYYNAREKAHTARPPGPPSAREGGKKAQQYASRAEAEQALAQAQSRLEAFGLGELITAHPHNRSQESSDRTPRLPEGWNAVASGSPLATVHHHDVGDMADHLAGDLGGAGWQLIGSGQVRSERWLPYGAAGGRGGVSGGEEAFEFGLTERGKHPVVKRPPGSGERTEVGYDWQWFIAPSSDAGLIITTRRIYLDGHVTDQQRQALHHAAMAGLAQVVNSRNYRLPLPQQITGAPGAQEDPLWRAVVKFVDFPQQAHAVVELTTGAPMRQDQWPTEATPQALAHELLHGFGLIDDQRNPQVLLVPGGQDDQHLPAGSASVMGPPASARPHPESLVLTPDHLREIAGVVRAERWLPYRTRGGDAGSKGVEAFEFSDTGEGKPPRVERPDGSGERTEVGYDWVWYRGAGEDPGVVVTTRRIFLAGATAEQRRAVQHAVGTGIDRLVNTRGYRLPLPDQVVGAVPDGGPMWRSAVDFVDSAEQAHGVVTLTAAGPITQDRWPVDATPEQLAHEILHGHGVIDDEPDDRVLLVPGGRGYQDVPAGRMSAMGPRPAGVRVDAGSMVLTGGHLRQIAEVLAPFLHRGTLPPALEGEAVAARSATGLSATNRRIDVAPAFPQDHDSDASETDSSVGDSDASAFDIAIDSASDINSDSEDPEEISRLSSSAEYRAAVGHENARVRWWLEGLATTDWPDVSRGGPIELSQVRETLAGGADVVLDARNWWRLYLDSDDHAAALHDSPDDPGVAYEAIPGGFSRAAMEAAYRAVLDSREVLAQPIDWASYRSMRASVTGADSDAVLGGREDSTYQSVGAPLLAHDMEDERIGDRQLVVFRDVFDTIRDAAAYGIVVAAKVGEQLGLVPAYSSRQLPELVNAVFGRYYTDIDAATSEYARLRAIGRLVRALRVMKPFPDSHSWLNTHFVLPRLLLANGFRPVILPAMTFMFSGGFSLHHIATALRWGQERSLTTGLDDGFGSVPLREPRGLLAQGGQSTRPSRPNTRPVSPPEPDLTGDNIVDNNESVRRWLESMSADVWPDVSRHESVPLSVVLPPQRWWRIYLDDRDHRAARQRDRSNPGWLYDSQRSAAFQADMQSAYHSVLDNRDVLQRPVDWDEYQRMYQIVTAQTRQATGRIGSWGMAGLRPGSWRRTAVRHYVALRELASDLTETLDGRPLVTHAESPGTFGAGEGVIAEVAPDHNGLLRLAILFDPDRLPVMVNEAFGRYHREVGQAGSEHEQLRAIARVVRTLSVMHPFRDGNGRLNINVLLPRLLLANGFQPVIVPSLMHLITGGLSLDQIATALRWGQGRDLATGLDDLRGAEPWLPVGGAAAARVGSASARSDASPPESAPGVPVADTGDRSAPPASDQSRAGIDTGNAAAPQPPTHPGGSETGRAPRNPARSGGLPIAEPTTTTAASLVHASGVLPVKPAGSAQAALRAVGTGVGVRTDIQTGTQTSTSVGQDTTVGDGVRIDSEVDSPVGIGDRWQAEQAVAQGGDLRWIGSQWEEVRGHPEFRQRLEAVYRWLSPSGGVLPTDAFRLDAHRDEPGAQAALRVLYMWHRSGGLAARRLADRQRVVARLRGGAPEQKQPVCGSAQDSSSRERMSQDFDFGDSSDLSELSDSENEVESVAAGSLGADSDVAMDSDDDESSHSEYMDTSDGEDAESDGERAGSVGDAGDRDDINSAVAGGLGAVPAHGDSPQPGHSTAQPGDQLSRDPAEDGGHLRPRRILRTSGPAGRAVASELGRGEGLGLGVSVRVGEAQRAQERSRQRGRALAGEQPRSRARRSAAGDAGGAARAAGDGASIAGLSGLSGEAARAHGLASGRDAPVGDAISEAAAVPRQGQRQPIEQTRSTRAAGTKAAVQPDQHPPVRVHADMPEPTPVRVPPDGWCLLYAVLVSTPPQHWPAQLRVSSDAYSQHRALVEELGSGEAGPRLLHAAGVLRDMVVEWVRDRRPAQLPRDVVQAYRASGEQLTVLEDYLDRSSDEELIGWLSRHGVAEVREPGWVSPQVLRRRYNEMRAAELTDGSGEVISLPAASERAESEVVTIDQVFNYLRERQALPAVVELDTGGLRAAVTAARVGQDLSPEEYQQLLGALDRWRHGTGGWNSSYGEMFPALVAHTLGVRLHYAGTTEHVGSAAAGRSVTVVYNGTDHYDGIVESGLTTPEPDTITSRGGADRILTVGVSGTFTVSVDGKYYSIKVSADRKNSADRTKSKVRVRIDNRVVTIDDDKTGEKIDGRVVTIYDHATGKELGRVTLRHDQPYYNLTRDSQNRKLHVGAGGIINVKMPAESKNEKSKDKKTQKDKSEAYQIYAGRHRAHTPVWVHIDGRVVTIYHRPTDEKWGEKWGEVTLRPPTMTYSIVQVDPRNKKLTVKKGYTHLVRAKERYSFKFGDRVTDSAQVRAQFDDDDVLTFYDDAGNWLGRADLRSGDKNFDLTGTFHRQKRNLKVGTNKQIHLSVNGVGYKFSASKQHPGQPVTVYIADDNKAATIYDAAERELFRVTLHGGGKYTLHEAGSRAGVIGATGGEHIAGRSSLSSSPEPGFALATARVHTTSAPDSDAPAPLKRNASPLPAVVVPSARWVLEGEEGLLDQSRTGFALHEAGAYNVDTDQWEWQAVRDVLGRVRRLIAHHRMEPIRDHDLVFPMRDPADPLHRVHPDYADEGGDVGAHVQVIDVKPQFRPSYVGLGRSRGDREAMNRLTAEVRTELGRLISNSRAGAPRQATFLSMRTVTRQVTAADGVAGHEQVLIGQQGLFVRPDVSGAEVRGGQGHMLGIYMGALLRGGADENRVEAVVPGFRHYLIYGLTARTEDGSYSGLGATNGVAFANTPLRRDLAGYDEDRINADFLGYTVKMTDARGVQRTEFVVVLVGRNNLEPGQQVLVNYGDSYLPLFQQPSTPVKREPHDDTPPL
jgi:hypothetical protein